ncbi:DnaD domain protein [Cytobacillus firmus]|uniref:DnaD domain protein n=1 Tax=Cytobacillus firmus TaxID=1399 RepID=UPI0036B372B0
MTDSFFFPTYSGLLTPQHKENIGPALWEFLWLISKTTKEIQEDGETLGIVLGGRPIKLSEIAGELGSSVRTVKRNIARLKDYHYIATVKAPYGEIYRIRKSKKFSKRGAKNGTLEREVPKMAPPEVPHLSREVPHLSKRSAKNGTSNKDIKDIKRYKTNKEDEETTVERILDLLEKSKILEKKDITEFLRDDIEDVISNFGFEQPEEMIAEAVKDAARGNGRTWKFVYKKLVAWKKKGIRTLAELENHSGEEGEDGKKVFQHRRGYGRSSSKTIEEIEREAEAARRAWGGS